jgi:hypothetical protein
MNNEYEVLIVDETAPLQYPCVVLQGILVAEQFKGFLVENFKEHFRSSVLAYGDRQGKLIELGTMALTATNIAKLQFLGIDIALHETTESIWYFEDPETYLDFFTFRREAVVCGS